MSTGDIEIVDGDDIKLGDQRYRLEGYDAPEISRFRSKIDQTLERRRGYQAKLRLKTLIHGAKSIWLLRADGDRRESWVIGSRRLAVLLVDGWDVATIAKREGWGVAFELRKHTDWGDPATTFDDQLPLPPAIAAEEPEQRQSRARRGS